VDTARNGQEAVEKNKALKPDVITMDVEMPGMDGLTALQTIMAEDPVPVLMVSTYTGPGAEASIKALELGAFDCVGKPKGKLPSELQSIQAELVAKIRAAYSHRSRYLKNPKSISAPLAEAFSGEKTPEVEKTGKSAEFLVAVASSTGGPRALHQLLSSMSGNFPGAFLVVQHMAMGFTKALARRLDEVSRLKVTEAEDGERVLEGHAYIAPAGKHLVVQGSPGAYRLAFNNDPPHMGVKPAADVLMASVAKTAGSKCLGIVLTGMGKDGTAGLKKIREAGGKTLAQDAESCVVYGMPKSAVEAGVVDHQLDLSKMVKKIDSFSGI
jgi:two-component system chemotaxis response regulator CheB